MTIRGKNEPKGAGDRRGAARKRVLLGGKIVYGDGAFSHECAIRDMSASGARLGIPGATVLPKEFYVLDLKRGTAFEAEVLWRNATQTGVVFRAAYDLAHIADPRLQFLRKLYVASCPR
jgi:hypothetical protein